MKQGHRFSGSGKAYEGLTKRGPTGPQWTGKIQIVPELLDQPLRWRTPKTIFVNSMSDLFHEDLPAGFIEAIGTVMKTANWHTYQVLTKRSSRMQSLLSTDFRDIAIQPHIWWGVSVENRRHGLPRIEHLRNTPAQVRFLSIEPLLEDLGPIDLEGIHWVIVGGESGPGARPIEGSWVRSIREQCLAARVPFFFKQWGGVYKKRAGRLLDGRTYDERPGLSTVQVPSQSKRDVLIHLCRQQATTWMYRQ
jgi:protein gp37